MDNKQNKQNNIRTLIIIIAFVAVIVVLAVVLTNPGNKIPELSYSEILDGIKMTDKTEDGVTNDNKIVGIYYAGDYNVNVLFQKDASDDNWKKFKKGKFRSATAVITNLNVFQEFYNDFAENHPEDSSVPYLMLRDPNSGSFMNYLFPALTLLLLAGLAVFMIFSMRGGKNGAGGAMNFGKTKARVSSGVKVRFTDVAGAEEEKEELREIVEFLKSPKKFRDVGARIPKGVLLVGSPGTGKTLFAKAVAGEANVPFFSISGSDFVEMYVGVGASRVRDLFSQAKRNQPCIIFIDEIDAVGRKRGAGLGGGNDEREQTLNQLLVQMDGFDDSDGIVIMAATNRADVLDPALLRPGRFDRQVYVNMPDVRGREAIFRVHSRKKPLSPDIDFKSLARLTTGFSGADIENLLNEAAILAARDGRTIILMKDIQEGINKVIAGPQKRSRVVTEKDKRITAYHEAGHAIVGRAMKHCDDVQEVSIIPRGMAAGYTISRPKSDDSHITKNRLNDEIAMMLGGRAAEEIVIQDISTGASQDIKQATGIARSMVTEWGMSNSLPNVFYGGEQEVFIGRDYQTQASYSEKVASVIDSEIQEIISTNYLRALNLLKQYEDVLHKTVRLLFAHETIYGDELDMLMDGKTVEEVNEYIENKRIEQQKIAEEKAKRDREREAALIKPVLGSASDIIVSEKSADSAENGETSDEDKVSENTPSKEADSAAEQEEADVPSKKDGAVDTESGTGSKDPE